MSAEGAVGAAIPSGECVSHEARIAASSAAASRSMSSSELSNVPSISSSNKSSGSIAFQALRDETLREKQSQNASDSANSVEGICILVIGSPEGNSPASACITIVRMHKAGERACALRIEQVAISVLRG
jgi:hypothetical protein